MKRSVNFVISFLLILINPTISVAAEQRGTCPNIGSGGIWKQGQLVTSDDGAAGDLFSYSNFGGYSAADSDGDRMIVGAIGDDINGFTWAGGAYIFEHDEGVWVQRQKLTPVNPATVGESTAFGGFLFGGAVSIDGDIAVVGEFEYNNNGAGLNLGRQGQATVYRYNAITELWEQDSILNAGAEEVFESNFGNSVTVDADGAPGDMERILAGGLGRTSEGGFWTGKAYVFDWNGASWDLAYLDNPAPSSNDYYGAFSDLDGDTAIVGTGSANLLPGEAWIFEYSDGTWGAGISLHALIPSNVNQDRFGSAVAVDSDFAVVGAYDSNAGGDGSVYIFWDNPVGDWELFDTLTDGDGDTDDQFGRFVDIQGNRILVSAPNNEVDTVAAAGSVYVYTFDGADWNFVEQINRGVPNASDGFANGATFADELILVGVGLDDTHMTNQGAVLFFDNTTIFKDGFETCNGN